MPAPQSEPPGGTRLKRGGLGLQPRNSIYATPRKSKTRAAATGARSCLHIEKSQSSTPELVRQLRELPKASNPQSSPPRWSPPPESSPGQPSPINDSPLSQYLQELKTRALQRAREIRGALAKKRDDGTDEVKSESRPDDAHLAQVRASRSTSSSHRLQEKQQGAIVQRTRGGTCMSARERPVARPGTKDATRSGSEFKPTLPAKRKLVASPKSAASCSPKSVASREKLSPQVRSVKRKVPRDSPQVSQRVAVTRRHPVQGAQPAGKEPLVIEQRTGAIQLNGVPGTAAAFRAVASPGRVLVRPKRNGLMVRRRASVSHSLAASPMPAAPADLIDTEGTQLGLKRRTASHTVSPQRVSLATETRGSNSPRPVSPKMEPETACVKHTQAVVTRASKRTTTSQRLVALLRETEVVGEVTAPVSPNVRLPKEDDLPPNSRKRPLVLPYVPPGVRHRQKEQEDWELEKAERRRRLATEDASSSNCGPRPPNIRALARKWEPKLELPGTCCFNPLQKDEAIEVDDACLQAEHDSENGLPGSALGVKGLPMVSGGRYQYEVELLCDSAVVVGWSAATSLPSTFDAQSFGYGPRGRLVGVDDGTEPEVYGLPFGRAGDVIGAFIEWPVRDPGAGPKISFALNGQWLGTAFDLTDLGRGATIGFPPLQLHVCQAFGLPFKVLLRGAHPSVPLRFRKIGFEPLGKHRQAHFCPFSEAVAQAGDVLAECRSGMGKTPTVARRLIHGSLGLQLPLSHLAQEIQVQRRSHRTVFACDDE